MLKWHRHTCVFPKKFVLSPMTHHTNFNIIFFYASQKEKTFSYPPSVLICSLWRLDLMQTCTSNDHTFTLRFIQRIKRKHAVTFPGYKSNSRVLYIDADYNGTTSWHNYLGIHYIAKDIMCVSTKKPSTIGKAAIEIAVLIFL